MLSGLIPRERLCEIVVRHRGSFDSAARRVASAWVKASIRKAFKLTFRRVAAARTRRFSSMGSLPTIWTRPGCPRYGETRPVVRDAGIDRWRIRTNRVFGRDMYLVGTVFGRDSVNAEWFVLKSRFFSAL